uniref:Uncharacterized protein n=1 Tax=Alexandrium monilatum TaxID=311494 RepID=A0A7S4VS14_9DINO
MAGVAGLIQRLGSREQAALRGLREALRAPRRRGGRRPLSGQVPLPPCMPAKQLHLLETARRGDAVRTAEVLEDPDADVSTRDEKLNTPLMYAALGGSLECVEYLVDMGADVACENSEGDTAFDLAVAEWGARFQEHPVIMFFKNVRAPRGNSMKSKMMSWLSK